LDKGKTDEGLTKEQKIFSTARTPKMPERSAPSLYGRSLQENWIKLTLSSFWKSLEFHLATILKRYQGIELEKTAFA